MTLYILFGKSVTIEALAEMEGILFSFYRTTLKIRIAWQGVTTGVRGLSQKGMDRAADVTR